MMLLIPSFACRWPEDGLCKVVTKPVDKPISDTKPPVVNCVTRAWQAKRRPKPEVRHLHALYGLASGAYV